MSEYYNKVKDLLGEIEALEGVAPEGTTSTADCAPSWDLRIPTEFTDSGRIVESIMGRRR